MNFKKAIFWSCGGVSAGMILLGVCLMVLPKTFAVVMGAVFAAISICFGLITGMPVFGIGLIAGVCMMLLPPLACGIIFAVVGCGGCVAVAVLGVNESKKIRLPD